MRRAISLARRAMGFTSPNPMVGAVLVRDRKLIGSGWHRRAGEPHAEIEALRSCKKHGDSPRGATLYVTLEPCCTHGRTPPCTDAIIEAGISKVIVGATDPNPKHRGRAFKILRNAGVAVEHGILADDCARLNEAFNHWIANRTPWVTVKAAMTLDGKIATSSGESKWITGERARSYAMQLRQRADAILVGINTVLADDPGLTCRSPQALKFGKTLRRIILDSEARTPISAKVVTGADRHLTTIIVGKRAPKRRVTALSGKVEVLTCPARDAEVGADLRWVLAELGKREITHLLVEGGGEVQASFLMQHLAHRVEFFYAPIILGGDRSRRAVAGIGARNIAETLRLRDLRWRRIGPDLLLSALVEP